MSMQIYCCYKASKFDFKITLKEKVLCKYIYIFIYIQFIKLCISIKTKTV